MHKHQSVGSLNASECYSHRQLEAKPLINPANDDSCCIDSSLHPLFHQPLLLQYFASVNTGIGAVDPGCLCHWSHLWCWGATFCLFVWWPNPFTKLADGTILDQYERKKWKYKMKNYRFIPDKCGSIPPCSCWNRLTRILQETVETCFRSCRSLVHSAVRSHYSVFVISEEWAASFWLLPQQTDRSTNH